MSSTADFYVANIDQRHSGSHWSAQSFPKRYATVLEAERVARKRLVRTGDPHVIWMIAADPNASPYDRRKRPYDAQRIACVSTDALDRVWCDVELAACTLL